MTNPYQPPASDPLPESPGEKLLVPAMFLVFLTLVHFSVYSPAVWWFFTGLSTGTLESEQVFLLGAVAFHGVFLALILVGACKMCLFRSYANARTAAELACIPLLTPLGLLGLPFGLWCLRILRKPVVKDEFLRREHTAPRG